MKCRIALFAGAILCAAAAPADLAQSIHATYPSLAYVQRYRADYPADVEGADAAWTGTSTLPPTASATDLTRALVGLADQHVALTGPRAGKSETIGVLFRTSADAHMIAWRIFDPRINALHSGDEIIAVDGVPTGDWLARTARLTFGGNARSRQAEAALNLGLGTQAVHEVAGLGKLVTLSVRPVHGAAYPVHLPYQPMTQPLAAAMAASVNGADLPDIVRAGPYRVGTVRIGAFAPQFDPVFTAAADAAPQSADAPDAAMLAGFCAVTRELIAHYDSIASHSDLMLVDLRGNMGGFGREVRAIAWAISGKPPITTYDVVAAPAGTVRLRAEPEDPSCGNVNSRKPLLVLVDAGTRSAGELLATYLWANGAIVLGERTVGAGGGRDAASTGIPTGVPGYRALISESFFLFDPKGEWHAGTMNETQFVARVAAQKFAPSRQRPYTTQAIGVLPDVPLPILWQDLRDNGSSLVARGIDAARQRGLLHK